MTPRFWLGLCALVLSLGVARAQNYLVVEDGGEGYVVQKVYNGFVYIKKGDKLVSVRKDRVMLAPAPEFLPVFVSVRNLQVKTSYVSLIGTGSDINNSFYLRADFSSSYALPDAYLVIELHTADAGRQIYYQEIGNLDPDHPRSIEAHIPLSQKLGEGKYHLHVFTGSHEVFNSQQPWQFREGMLDKMVVKRIAEAKDAPPRPFVGPAPEYPKELRKARTAGTATVQIHITRTGVVTKPVVKSATTPAFGEAALEAVRQWRFLPRIKGGKPVEADAEMPFDFTAPAEPEKN